MLHYGHKFSETDEVRQPATLTQRRGQVYISGKNYSPADIIQPQLNVILTIEMCVMEWRCNFLALKRIFLKR
jgi:hypothetical protein